MKTYLKTVIGLAAGLALAALVFAVGGCGGASDNYTRVQTTLSGADITYEYPADYQMPPGGIGDNAITYLHYLGKVQVYNADTMLFIETDNITPGQTAATMMEQSITSIRNTSVDFSLIKRTTTTVAGYDAELLAFTTTFTDTPLTSVTVTAWVAYFTRGDRVWEIGVMADADLGSHAETEYRHLVGSFTFK